MSKPERITLSRARTFKKCEIADFMREASVNGLAVVMHPTGEVEAFPAIHRRSRAVPVDAPEMSEADKALAKWMAKHGEGQNAGRA